MSKFKSTVTEINFKIKGSFLSIFFIVLLFLSSYSQTKQGSYWYFGQHAGLKFNPSGSLTVQTNGATTGAVNMEGTATISDTAGNLLFYTDGMTVWNKNHVPMTNGTGLLGHASSTQSAVIVPRPHSTDSFFIFTIDAAHNNLANGLRYSIVNMSLSAGAGSVTATKNILLSSAGVLVAEKITAVKHCNNRDIWVICHGYGSTNGNKFYAYLITASGVTTTPIVSTIGTTHNGGDVTGYGNARGYMKASPDGKKIAVAIPYDGCTYPPGNINFWTQGSVEVFDFNIRTGAVSNPIKFTSALYKGSYGIEFSPSGTRLYASQWGSYNDPSTVYQWNLLAGSTAAIQASATRVGPVALSPAPGALQLALNSKIYIVKNTGTSLDVINNPNNPVATCGYTANAVALGTGRYGMYGLPTFIASYFNPSYNVASNYSATPASFTIDDTTQLDSVFWNFGDIASGANNISRLFNPKHTYQDTGSYNIQLIIYKCGIADTVSGIVRVYPLPHADFSINDSDQCLSGNNFTFTNLSTLSAGSMTYLWKFGDAVTSTLTSPSHTYTTVGNRTVWLIVTSSVGAKDSVSKQIYVRPAPVSGFNINNNSQCLSGNNFSFTNTTTGASASFWRFGDATTSTTTSPSHTYGTIGPYTVKLVSTTAYGCKDSITKTLTVRPQPIPAFSINNNSQCLSGNNFIFSNTSTGTSASLWRFGDATTSTITSPSHSYTTAGAYTVKLISTTTYGCKDSTTKTLDVRPQPVSSFTIDDNDLCLSGNEFEFTNTATGASTYLWRFGDATTSTNSSPTHTYTSVGTFTVKLISTTTFGCKDSTTKVLYVRPQPVSGFTINNNSQCLSGNNFIFSNTSTGSSASLWRFGDATTSTITSPSHSYTTAGAYTVKLISTTTYGCKDSTTKTLDVRPPPVSSFTINNNSQCLSGNNFSFTNTTTGASSFLWRFGDATTSTTTSPSHSYSSVGAYTVKLISTTSYGCKDSTTRTLDVRPQPVSSFTINNNSQCLSGNNFSFTNTTPGASSYLWDFGDASTSSTTSPSHSYGSAGAYTVKLVSTTIYGCKDSTTKTLDVRAQPVAAFNINNNSQCLSGNNFVFSNTSTGASTFLWNFGDAATSTATSPSHSYSTVGAFTVKLISTTTFGCKDSTTKTLDVRPQPVSAFTINNNSQCLSGNNFSFTNTSTGASSYLWNFGDATTSTSTSPSHSYTTDGAYTVKLVSITSYGCKDSTTKTLDVRPQPVSGFNINNNSQCLNGNNFSFTSTTTGATSNFWNFGDASTSTITSPSHSYSSVGTFTVKLISTSSYGCKDSTTKNLDVRAQPVTAFSIADTILCLRGNSFAFTNSSSGNSSNLWKFGDGATSVATNPSHSYSTSGTFQVKLITSTTYNCKDSLTKNVHVNPQSVASFSIADTSLCLNGNNFAFTNSSSNNTSIFWKFGDGATSTSTNPTHSYAVIGTYQVKLITANTYNCNDSLIKNVYVRAQPVAAFSIADTSLCLSGNNFAFTNSSSGSASNLWKFGDGATSVGTNPSHSYSTAGTFQVKLITSTAYNCKDSLTKNVYVRPQPITLFSIADTSLCLNGNNFAFTNTSTGASTYRWNFGDATTSTATSPSHSYSSAGAYTVKLVSTNSYGCNDSNSKVLYVRAEPVSGFTINNNSQCLSGNNFAFSNTATAATIFLWNFGDAATSTASSPSHSYSAVGSYTVKLVSTTAYGCKDSNTKTLDVRPQPVSGFTINNNSQCLSGNNFSFTNTATGASTFLWDFGDAATSTSTSPSHNYTIDGAYTVKLVSVTSYGCKDSNIKTLDVRPQPVSGFTINNNSQCLNGNNFVFTNTTSGASTFLWNFGDAATSTATSPSHSYLAIGSYSVKLGVTSTFGCKDSITKTLDVRPQPVSGFTINNNSQCLSGNNFSFSNTATGASTFLWDFGDAATSTSTSPSHSYSIDGAFTVKLVSVTSFGCKDSNTKSLDVRPQPVSGFTINNNSQCLNGNNFAFTNTTTGSSSFLWNFGDAATSTATSPSHSYLAIGSYSVKLVVTTTFGCKDSITKTLDVRPEPVSGFTLNNNSQCLSGNNFSFTNTATGASTFLWNFGDATTSTSTSPSHSYTTDGAFTVKLVSITSFGCKDSNTKTLDVRPQPVSGFAINNNSQCLNGNNFAFTNTTTGASSFLWNFGDANTSTATSPSHSYTTDGAYTVKLISTTSFGCKDSNTKTLDVRPQPVSGFTINNNSQCLSGNNFSFTNTTSVASTFLWNFGDAATSTATSPSHSYSAIGSYTVKLVSTTAYGCTDSNSKNLDVRPQPISGFTINNNSQCLSGNNFSFTNTATGASTFLWNFGDAATSTSTSPSHNYTIDGAYTVKLVSVTSFGCKDSNIKTLDVRPQPVSGFTINNNSQCLNGNNFVFTNTTSGASTFLWNFGDAATSTATSPSHSYLAIGSYSVKLGVTSTFGCKDSITKTLDVRPQPVSGFTINNNSQCFSGNNFSFSNTATGASTFLWDFGDATTSTASSPSHSYSIDGAFTVKLVSVTSFGCKDSNTKTLDVRPQPVSGFTINNNSQCLNGNNFAFTNTTTGSSSFLWNFGDAATSTATSPSHSYLAIGSYSVKLVSTTTFACKDSITKTLDVRPQPISGFTINNNSQCLSGNNFSFTNTATGASTFLWNFGDAATSPSTSPSHSYSAVGSYTVKLISTTAFGCKDSNAKTLDVRPQPVSGFTINNNSQCLSGNNFSFTNTATGASTFLWNFGDATTSTTTSPSHSYSSAGAYPVKLVSVTSYGCKDSNTKTLDVRPQPVSGFTINNNSQCLSGNNFAFANTTTGASTYRWTFGDAATSTTTSPSHSYLAIGSYSVKLVATTTFGCKDSITKTLDVRPQPISGFTINNNSQCLSGNNFSFTNTATGASTFLWKFGDATTSATTSPSHSYTTAGAFTVKLISTTSYGCKDSNTKTLDVRPQPVSGFTINNNSQCLNGNNFAFTNTTTGAPTYRWTFGDATTSTATSPSHSYSAIGSYSVKLVATTTFGCKDSITKTLDVRPQPISGFTINNNSQCLSGNSFVFTNTATGASTFLWRFGDATTSTATSPSHSYTTAGAFTVKLISTTAFGCKDSNTKTLDVRPQPVSAFTINNNSQCLTGNSFTFTNTASGAVSYLWRFGDASTSASTSPSHSYTTAGAYTVKLISTTSYGCKDSTTKTLDVRPQPVSGFTINNNSQCLSGNNFVFTNTATGASTFLWKFGDAATSTATSPSHSYLAIGSYTVKLISTTTYGCKDSNTKSLDVRPQPVSGFTINNNSQCLSGNSFVFTNTATGAISYLWKFGDATTSTATSPSHSYTTAGAYTAKLISTTTFGCKDSNTKTLDVRPQPVSGFTINNNSQCLNGNSFVFTNTTTGASTFRWTFGDASTSTTTSPSHSYLAIGSYSVKLVATSTFGCKDSNTKTLDVRPQPVSGFTINNNSQCLSGNSFVFTNTATGASTYLWRFGDATTSTATSPSHNYTTAGAFTVKLISTTAFGCKDSNTKALNVRPQTIPAFSINNNSQCLRGNSFVFLNTTTGALTYQWKFGDATTSTATSPSHSYAAAGTFTVKLFATTNYGCLDSTIKTLDVRAHPVTSFTINDTDQCLSGNNFSFSNTSSNYTIQSWKFGDAGTSALTSPSHSYIGLGSFVTKLVTRNSYNCSDSLSKRVYVRPHPTTSFSINDSDQCLSGNNVVFTNASAGASSYVWKFGDASSSALTSPTHKFLSNGIFAVKLISTNVYTCKDSAIKSVYIRALPVVNIMVNDSDQCLSGNSFAFSNSSAVPYTYNWKFGDAAFSGLATPTHSYADSGIYKVKLIATNSFLCTDSTIKTVYVRKNPKTQFSINDTDQCLIGNNFVLTNTTSAISNSLWKFGDANTSTIFSPSHTYILDGTYTISLLTTNAYSCSDSTSKTVYIRQMPKSSFTVNDSDQCLSGNNFIFSNASTGATTYLWKLGDGNTSTSISKNYTYTNAGNYNVKLVGYNFYNCADTFTKSVYIRPLPFVSFSINDNTQCFKGNNFNFTNLTAGNNTYLWKLGDNQSSTDTNTSHVYSKSGWLYVKLIARNNFGCFDSLIKPIRIYPDITITKKATNILCFGGNNGSIDINPITGVLPFSYLWSTGSNLSKISNLTAGKYQLTITDSAGCSYQDSTILTEPVSITTTINAKRLACKNACDGIIEASIAGGKPPFKYLWDNGKKTSTISNLCEGWYRLIAQDSNLCTHPDSIYLNSNPLPVPTLNHSGIINVCSDVGVVLTLNEMYKGYSWSDGSKGSTNYVTINGRFYVSVTDSNKCIGKSDTVVVNLINLKNDIYLKPYYFHCFDSTLRITLPYNSNNSYLWQPTGFTGNSIELTEEGNYIYTITNDLCSYTDSIKTVNLCSPTLYIPNAFSPNGDGINDVFKIVTKSVDKIGINIYSHWGQLVYSSSGSEIIWDGKYKGDALPDDVYYFIVTFSNSKYARRSQHGTITLIK